MAKPPAPQSLVANPGRRQATLRWVASAAATTATTYNVKRSSTSGGPYAAVVSNLSKTEYVDQGLPSGETYYYVVTAVEEGVESETSSEVSARVRPSLTETLIDPGAIIGLVISLFGIVILVKVLFGYSSILDDIRDQAYARGVITLTVTFSTVVIAFVLVVSALFGNESSDDRFRRGREIFGVLAGVLGTVVGFYFGSADKDTKKLALSAIHFTATGLTAIAYGGVPPYQYSIEIDGKKTPMENRPSPDGWIAEDRLEGLRDNAEVKLSVVDGSNQTVSVSRVLPKPSPSPAQ